MSSVDKRAAGTFVSEAIIPVEGTFSPVPMAVGEPSLPRRFRWRETEVEVSRVIERWKTSDPDQGGGAERYVRKHWFLIETSDGARMRIYFERQPRSGQSKNRWWLATLSKE